MQWSYGHLVTVGLPFLAALANWKKEEPCPRAQAVVNFLFQIIVVALTMANIAPLAPMAITLIAYNAFYGYYSSASIAPFWKESDNQDDKD